MGCVLEGLANKKKRDKIGKRVKSDGVDRNKMHTLRKRRSSEKRKKSNRNTKLKMQELWEMFPRKLLKATPQRRERKTEGEMIR